MGGLVTYESSDEEDDVLEPTQPQTSNTQQEARDTKMANGSVSETTQATKPSPTEPLQPPPKPSSTTSTPQQLGPIQGPALGPSLGPSLPDSSPATPDPTQSPNPDDPPKSPYTSTRSLLHSLTLPTVPNTSIPPSPPGSPPAALTAKFDTFLSLKSNPTNPIHFNARLANSAAARNPGLMDKLLGFVGVETGFEDGKGTAQYQTTLSKDCGWDPDAFPAWAFKNGLRRAAERAGKERERKAGERVEFVAAGGEDGMLGGGGASVPPPVTGKRKTRFDA